MTEPPKKISKVDYFIKNYKEERGKLPNTAVIDNFSYEYLKTKGILIQEINNQTNENIGYILHKKQKIQVYKYEKLSKKIQSELEEKVKKTELPVILCISGPIKKFKEPIPYDLVWTKADITQTPENEKSN